MHKWKVCRINDLGTGDEIHVCREKEDRSGKEYMGRVFHDVAEAQRYADELTELWKGAKADAE